MNHRFKLNNSIKKQPIPNLPLKVRFGVGLGVFMALTVLIFNFLFYVGILILMALGAAWLYNHI